MSKPKLKTPKSDPHSSAELPSGSVPLSPLSVSGVVVKKKHLVEALRIYVPLISDIQSFEDGEHFYLMLDGQNGKVE